MSQSEHIQTILETVPHPQFVFNPTDGTILIRNARFDSFLGYRSRDPLPLDDVVEPEARHWFEEGVLDAPKRVRFIGKDGTNHDAEVQISLLTVDGDPKAICHVHDLTERNARDAQRREEAERSRKQNIEVARANVRLYELTERVSITYDLTASLLNAKNFDELTKKAAGVMTEEQGLNAKEVVFMIKEGDLFKVKTSGRRRISRPEIKECEEALQSFEQDQVIIDRTRGVLILPLVSRGRVQGVMRVAADPADSPVFAASHEPIRSGALDTFKTLANMVSIMIDNLRLYQDLERQSVIDPLTGAFNRRYFDRKSRREIKRALRYGEELSFILIDVDQMKALNDNYGHQAADRMLKDLTHLLMTHCREEDAVCRYGGDEFLVILVETGLDGAQQKAESLRALVSKKRFTVPGTPNKSTHLTISSGVASLSEDVDDERKLFHAVDQALYRAKQARNTVST